TMVIAHFNSAQAANAYLGTYASAVNAMTFVCLALGINNITRWLGIRTSLALVPLIVGGAVGIFFVYPQLSALFAIMVGAKAINYALNQPSLKQLYIPTTENAKYKSQAWIETFGSRSAKAAASFLNMSKNLIGSQAYFVLFALLSISSIVGWFLIALYLAHVYTCAIAEKRVVC
ncbi:hypothetical protein CVU75_03160, partial [Candidatus Dependentiae bacterium HGW-Dependentiae-1]